MKRIGLLLSFLLLALISVFFSAEAQAISNVLPGGGNQNQYLLVAKSGNGNALDAPVLYARVYFKSAAGGNVTIWDADHCAAGVDSNTAAPTTYLAYSPDANEDFNVFFPDRQVGNLSNQPVGSFLGTPICGVRSIAFTNLTESTLHPGWFTGVFVARHDGPLNGGGVNAFKLSAANSDGTTALIGQFNDDGVTAASGDPGRTFSYFATQDRVSAQNTYSNFTYNFAPSCDWGSRSAYLKWRDADFGQGNQGSNPQIGFFLIERNRVTGVQTNAWNVPVTGGQDAYEQYRFTARSDRTYEWVWYNVRKTNGLQIYMPFAEIETLNDCVEDPEFSMEPTATCSIQNGRAIFTVENEGPDSAETTATIQYGVNGLNTTVTRNLDLDDGEEWQESFPVGALTIGDEIWVSITIDPSNQDDDTATAGSTTTYCDKLVFRPTVQVRGADVWAGGNFDSSGASWCAPAIAGAGIDTNSGSGTNYGATAVGEIRDFTTGAANSNILAFANNGTPGNFNTQGKCARDYYAILDKNNLVAVPNYASSGQYYVEPAGELVLPRITLPAGRKITVVVNGDVRISENITYDYATVGDRNEIPAFVLVVNGTIDIAPGVTRLDGLYVAGTNGVLSQIDTCAGSQARLTYQDECSQQLIVNGAFMASNIEFRRTHGTLGSTVPAELFRVSPEFYLAQPILDSPYISNLETTSQRDLPPVQ